MIEYRVLKTIVLGYIDPEQDEQRDALVRPGDAPIGFDGAAIFLRRRDGRWLETITVNRAIEEWLRNGSIEQLGAGPAAHPAVLVGQAIGDALGMPFERLGDEVHPDLATWDGSFRAGTWHALPAGHWTDDTEMAECLASSLVQQRGFDGEDVARRYLAWSQGTPHGMGGTTRRACEALARGVSWRESGVALDDPDAVGSAPPMRAAPIGAACADAPAIYAACAADARITHAHPEAVDASFAVALTVSLVLQGASSLEVLGGVCEALRRERGAADATLVEQSLSEMRDLRRPHPPILARRRGSAWQITSTAICCALWAESYRDGVVAAVKIGGDADTRGAIAGAILGARFGLAGIPDEYKTGLLGFDHLSRLDGELLRVRRRTGPTPPR